MSVYFSSINSGSNGNCYYVGTQNEAILVDVGISCRELEKRLARLNLNLSIIKAIFISHEHTDHIKGLNVLCKKHNIKVYITKPTLHNSNLKLADNLINHFYDDTPIVIGDFTIKPFRKNHDAADPFSFTISIKQHNIGIFTDIGSVCNNLINHFKNCNVVFLEANYDTDMLENGNYPIFLKNRIRNGYGHLSNNEALALFQNYKHEKLSHLILCHLSLQNNKPDLVSTLFSNHAKSTKIIVASRHEETELFCLQKNSTAELIFIEN
jgi:phosphoribosyl 1,2-cyclic phosphodiesterase